MEGSRNRINFLFCLLLIPVFAVAANDEEADIWSALHAGGHVVLIRHAITEPGIGDPPGFRLGDCKTQRNLSPKGREDAERIGEAFRRRGVTVSAVLSSRWCRCIDTARLAFGRATPAPMLDSMYNDKEKSVEEKLREVAGYIAGWRESGNLVLVTHNQNIQALTGISPVAGEMVVAMPEKNGKLRVVGRIASPEP